MNKDHRQDNFKRWENRMKMYSVLVSGRVQREFELGAHSVKGRWKMRRVIIASELPEQPTVYMIMDTYSVPGTYYSKSVL